MSGNSIDQIRYYSINNEKNTHSFDDICNKHLNNQINIYQLSNYLKIKEFNIKTLPGTRINFQYRRSFEAEDNNHILLSIIIDHSGVYNLDCTDFYLEGFSIDKESLEIINRNDLGYFIATIIY